MQLHQLYIILFVLVIWSGCDRDNERVYFFLDGYPELFFVNESGNPVPTSFFVEHINLNGMSVYQVQDTSLTLVYRKSRGPYTGFIRTYHWDIYNIEGVFEEGKIKRLRYWHPNRQLAMDTDFRTGVGNVWTFSGQLSVSWDREEIQTRNHLTGKIKSISNDTISYYFDFEGELNYYTTRNDSVYYQYYADGSPRFQLPVWHNGDRKGIVKRWHPNGQLQAIGQYLDGVESGTWIEYDSQGNEVERIEYN